MDKVLITYRGGYGDIHSILSSYHLKQNKKITFLIEDRHSFLKQIYPWVTFIRNPIKQLYEREIFSKEIEKHIAIKEDKNFNQKLYDESVIETAFYIWSKYDPYSNFYSKLISEHDLVITNYLDITCIDNCKKQEKEWWLIKSWADWPKESYFLNILNQSSPFKNIYYYEREWIKDYKTEENAEYKYCDTNFYKFNINENEERFKLTFKTKNKKNIFFATLGSMSMDSFNIGRNVKDLYINKIKQLFSEGWYGITTEREYKSFLKEEINHEWVFLVPEWYSHDIIFDYIDLFLTHGGAGSFARAIKKNKKMIVFPFQLDQFYFGEIAKKHYEGELIV